MSQPNGEPIIYVLYAVLVHTGFNCHAGHYFCYIKVSCRVATKSAVGQHWIHGTNSGTFIISCDGLFFFGVFAVLLDIKLNSTSLCGFFWQASNGLWYQMNDSIVSTSDIRSVLNQQAYVLFYIR